jgi:hypothetical protein
MVAMHDHDVTNFDKIAKMNGKTTIYHHETLQSTRHYATLAIVSLRFFWLIGNLGRYGRRHGRHVALFVVHWWPSFEEFRTGLVF